MGFFANKTKHQVLFKPPQWGIAAMLAVIHVRKRCILCILWHESIALCTDLQKSTKTYPTSLDSSIWSWPFRKKRSLSRGALHFHMPPFGKAWAFPFIPLHNKAFFHFGKLDPSSNPLMVCYHLILQVVKDTFQKSWSSILCESALKCGGDAKRH